MGVWEGLIGGVVATVFAVLVKRSFEQPDKLRDKDSELAARLSQLESKVAVLQETKATETQVRTIVHEQIQPLLLSVSLIEKEQVTMKVEQERQSGMLARIEDRITMILDKLNAKP